MKTCIEDFSNELILEVFDYLDGIDIYRAFSKLNHRFNCLLTTPHLNTKINVFSTSQDELTSYFNDIILPYKTQLVSLFLWNNQVIQRFKSHLLCNILFDNLQSLVLHKIRLEELFSLLPNLTSLPCLFTLTIDCEYQLSSIIDLYLLIFRLPMLRHNKLTLNDQTYLPTFTTIPQQINIIQYLDLDYACTLPVIIQILSHTQQLTRFRCKNLLKSNEILDENLVLHLPNLTHMTIESCNEKFEYLRKFLRRICTHLKKFKLSTSTDIQYLDVHQWQNFITQYMPCLTKFDFEYQQIVSDDFQVTRKHLEFFRLKLSTFSIEHKWLFGFKIYVSMPSNILAFTISSKRNQYDPISQLTVNFIAVSTQRSFVNINITPIVTETDFTHLDIKSTMMSPNMIIDLLNVCPNLRELNVSYLKLSSCAHLLENHIIENNIEKVTIGKLNDLCELKFFINLCRQMKYLEIGLGNNIKVELFLQRIFIENSERGFPLSTICIHIPPLIENLQSIIQSSNYLIECIGSKVVLTLND